jgi:hypothetical protein
MISKVKYLYKKLTEEEQYTAIESFSRRMKTKVFRLETDVLVKELAEKNDSTFEGTQQ